MSKYIKDKVMEIYNERHEIDNSNEIEKNIENIVNDMISNKNNIEILSDSTEENNSSNEELDNLLYQDNYNRETVNRPPYCYIDYNSNYVKIAKEYGYKTIHIKKGKLGPKIINDIIDEKYFKFKDTHVIINLWHVLTKSNLGCFSNDITDNEIHRFEHKFESIMKWGSKQFLKDKLSKTEQRNYNLFIDGIEELLRILHSRGVRIFIICDSHYSFVKNIFKYYKLDKYIEQIFTPSKCILPHAKITSKQSYKDTKKINKEIQFACIEKYIGRLPIKT